MLLSLPYIADHWDVRCWSYRRLSDMLCIGSVDGDDDDHMLIMKLWTLLHSDMSLATTANVSEITMCR